MEITYNKETGMFVINGISNPPTIEELNQIDEYIKNFKPEETNEET